MAHPNKLAKTHTLIFGGTSGIGFGVANLLLSQSSSITISGSNQPRISATISRLQSHYPNLPDDRISGFPCDLADTKNLETNLTTLFDNATNNGEKKINHVVFTAGDMSALPSIKDVTIEDIIAIGRIRIVGAILIAKLIASSQGKYMPLSPSSSITLTGGVNTDKPSPRFFLGAAMGGGLQGLVRGLAVDMAPVRVNLVEPGAVKTELLDRALERVGREREEVWREKTLVGKLGEPGDVAEGYAYFMRDGFVTGTVLKSNGGVLLK